MTKRTVLDDAVDELFIVTPDKTSEQIGASFVSFLLEAQHGSWDGVPARDKAAMGRFVADYTMWLKSSTDNDLRSPVVFTGSRYLTKDR